MDYNINFPHLHIYLQHVIKSISIGSFDIAMYGIIIACGMLAGLGVACYVAKKSGQNPDTYFDLALVAIICSVIGARIYYVVCNREAFGDYYDGLFAMQLPVSAVRTSDLTEKLMSHTTVVDGVEYISVHPTFLYESFWNLCLFILLMLYFKHRRFDGEVFLLYLLGYGIGRFWIESLRTDQLLIPHINYPVSMALAATLVAVSAIWIGIVRYKQMKMGKMVDTPPQSTTKE